MSAGRCAHVPEALGAALLLLVLVGGVGLGLYSLVTPATEWVAKAPESLTRVQRKLRALRSPMEEMSRTADRVERTIEGDSTTAPVGHGPRCRLPGGKAADQDDPQYRQISGRAPGARRDRDAAPRPAQRRLRRRVDLPHPEGIEQPAIARRPGIPVMTCLCGSVGA